MTTTPIMPERLDALGGDDDAGPRSSAPKARRPKRSLPLTIVTGIALLYTVVPLLWLVFNSTKTQSDLFSSFGLWFGDDFSLWSNIRETFSYDDHIFVRWFANTLLYVGVGAGGATALAVMGGYALAKFQFPGKKAVFAVVIGAVAVPGTALAVPTFLMFSQVGLTNTP
jgi:multiple sugar transport system permease protein